MQIGQNEETEIKENEQDDDDNDEWSIDISNLYPTKFFNRNKDKKKNY